ncbi:hypothetical protein ACR3K2_22830 [Cryptosporidium serpentis]
MWANKAASFLSCSSELARILRQCLKEPYRSKAIKRSSLEVYQSNFLNGTIISRELQNILENAMENSDIRVTSKQHIENDDKPGN